MKKQMKNWTNEKGVTLLVLGITIVVLLILAGITISMLTKDDGIIKQAENAAIQTEVGKVFEKIDVYLRNKEMQQINDKDFSEPTTEEQLGTTICVVDTADEPSMHLGIIQDPTTLKISSEYGKNGLEASESWNSKKMEELDDVFALDLDTNTLYYIADGRMWSTGGEVTIADIEEDKASAPDSEEQQKDGPSVTAEPATATELPIEFSVTISAQAKAGRELKSNNSYQYYVSTSSSRLSGGEWKEYVNASPITISGESGASYYVFVKRVVDSKGIFSSNETVNVSGEQYHRFGPYTVTSVVTEHNVTYDYSTNGGNKVNGNTEGVKVEEGQPVNLGPTAEKEGWVFEGWNTDPNAHTKLNSLTMGITDVKLYAIFSKELTGVFNSAESTKTNVTEKIYNKETEVKITAPTIKNVIKGSRTYVGKGWSTNSTTEATVEVLPGGNVTLKDGVESPNYYAVYAAEGGSGATGDEVTITFNYWNGRAVGKATQKIRDRLDYNGDEVPIGDISVPPEVSGSNGPKGTTYAYVSNTEKGTDITPSVSAGLNYYAVYKKDITVTKYTYKDASDTVTGEMKGYYDGTVDGAVVKLEGSDREVSVEVNGQQKQAKPRGWSTSPEPNAEVSVEINGNTPALEADTPYYMSYSYEVTPNYKDEKGQEQQGEKQNVYVGSNGETATDGEGEGTFGLPESLTPPDGWTKFEGWTTDEEPGVENLISPEEDLPDPDATYNPVFSKEIQVTEYTYPSNTPKKLSPAKAYTFDGKKVTPAKVQLDTISDVTVSSSKVLKGQGWSTEKAAHPTEMTAGEGKVVAPGATVNVTGDGDTDWYAYYMYQKTVNWHTPDGNSNSESVDIYVSSEGTEEGEDISGVPQSPSAPAEWGAGWEIETGTGTDDGGNGIEKGKEVWTTDPTHPDQKEKWLDPSKPGDKLEGDIYPVYKKDVTVTRNIYKDGQAKQHPEGDPIEATIYRANTDTIIYPTVELGTIEEVPNIAETYTGTPLGWYNAKTGNKKDPEVKLTNTKVEVQETVTYNAAYKYTKNIKYIDPTDKQEKDATQDVYIGGDGQEEAGPTSGTLPASPTPPADLSEAGWKADTEKPWTTNPEDPTDQESRVDPTNPDEKLDPNKPLYPVYKKDITVTRHKFNGTREEKVEPDLTGVAYRSTEDNTVKPAQIKLLAEGESIDTFKIEKYDIGNGQTTTLNPDKWQTKPKSDESYVLGQTLSLTDNKDLYLSYTYDLNNHYIDENGDEQENTQKVEVDSEGNKTGGESQGLPEAPTVPEDLEQKGWKPDNEDGKKPWTTNPDNPADEGSRVDPSEGTTDPDAKIYPVYKNDITITKKYYDGSQTQTDDSTTGTAYLVRKGKDDDVTVPYTVDIEMPSDPNKDGFTSKGWSKTEEGLTADITQGQTTVSVTENTTYYAIYVKDSKEYTFKYYAEGAAKDSILNVGQVMNYKGVATNTGDTLAIPEAVQSSKGTLGYDFLHVSSDPKGTSSTALSEATTTYYAVYAKDVKAIKHENGKEPQNTETQKAYDFYDAASQTYKPQPATINLGKADNATIDGETAEPVGWFLKNLQSGADVQKPDVENNGDAQILQDTNYYAIYKHSISTQVQTGDGQTEQKQQDVYTDSEGNNQGGGLDPSIQNPTVPPELESKGWSWRGWTTNPDDLTDESSIVDPAVGVTDKSDTLTATFKKDLTVNRTVYLNKSLEVINATAYRSYSDDSLVKPKVDLQTGDTTPTVGLEDGFTAKGWSNQADAAVTDAFVEIKGNKAEIELDAEAAAYNYYMVYQKGITVTYHYKGKTQVENPNKTIDYKNTQTGATLQAPTDTEDATWEFQGWVLEAEKDLEPSAQHPNKAPASPATDIDYYALYSKQVTVTRVIYNGTQDGDSATMEPLTGPAYKKYDNTTVAFKKSIGHAPTANTNYTSRGWAAETDKDDPTPDTITANDKEIEALEDAKYYALYESTQTITFRYNGEPSSAGTTTSVGAKMNYAGKIEDDEKITVPLAVSNSTGKDGIPYVGVTNVETGSDPVTPTVQLGTTYYAVYKKDIKITKVTYKNTESQVGNTTVVGNYKGEATGVKPNLGGSASDTVSASINSSKNVTATPKGWLKSTSAITADPDVALGGEPTEELFNDTTYHMVYTYPVEITYTFGDNSTQKVNAQALLRANEETKGLAITNAPSGSTIKTPSDTGAWTFDGWVKTSDGYEETKINLANGETNPYITYYARHTKTEKITRHVWQSATMDDLTFTIKSVGNSPQYPKNVNLGQPGDTQKPSGYNNRYWASDGTSAKAEKSYDNNASIGQVKESAEYYQTYQKTVKIKYDLQDGKNGTSNTIPDSEGTAYKNYSGTSIEYDKPKLTTTEPTKEGFNFLGWSTSSGQSSNPTYPKSSAGDEISVSEEKDLTLYAVWETAVKPSDPEEFGGDTNYSCGGITDWKLFYANGGDKYLIAGDYMNNSNLPSGTSMTKGNTYNVYWSGSGWKRNSIADVITSTTLADRFFTRAYYDKAKSQSQNNTKAVAELLDTSVWTNQFVTSDLKSKGAQAIGSPTIELWCASWNAKYPTEKIYCNATPTTTGYFISTSDKGTSTYIDGSVIQKYAGWKNTLYYPHPSTNSAWNNCYGFWLASPSANYASGVMYVYYNGYITRDGYSISSLSLRPVVYLPESVSITKGSNNKWNIS